VLAPPIGLDAAGERLAVDGVAPGFFLAAARLMPYKNLDAVVSAFAELPTERLVVAGEGPDGRHLRASAPANVRFLGTADDSHLRWLYANCRAVVCAGFESYGLTPLEGAAFGKPTVALRDSGLADVVVEGVTGAFFERAEPDAIRDAVKRLDATHYDAASLRRLAEDHDRARFVAGLRRVVEQELDRVGSS
jgi:glycosyltransferase involved in cell wall biosynthesis